MGHFQNIT